MDDIVKAALKKWPNVPHAYGWLALDARGDWYLRDEQTQSAGPFPKVKGSRITHDKLKEFINRNYEHDDRGAWFFQNGPQRVYVEVEAAPLVLGVRAASTTAGEAAAYDVEAHTGQPVGRVHSTWLDQHGRLFLETDAGLGVVRSLDMGIAADALEAGVWAPPQDVGFEALPARFGYCLKPEAEHREEDGGAAAGLAPPSVGAAQGALGQSPRPGA